MEPTVAGWLQWWVNKLPFTAVHTQSMARRKIIATHAILCLYEKAQQRPMQTTWTVMPLYLSIKRGSFSPGFSSVNSHWKGKQPYSTTHTTIYLPAELDGSNGVTKQANCSCWVFWHHDKKLRQTWSQILIAEAQLVFLVKAGSLFYSRNDTQRNFLNP